MSEDNLEVTADTPWAILVRHDEAEFIGHERCEYCDHLASLHNVDREYGIECYVGDCDGQECEEILRLNKAKAERDAIESARRSGLIV